jgi:rhodanese-related sulfurtransferase
MMHDAIIAAAALTATAAMAALSIHGRAGRIRILNSVPVALIASAVAAATLTGASPSAAQPSGGADTSGSAAPIGIDAAKMELGALPEDFDSRKTGKGAPAEWKVVREDLHRKSDALPRARWRDPEHVAEWASAVPRGVPAVAYCLYGFQVSQDAAAELRKLGIGARALAGGIAAWRASGFPTEPAPPA